MKHCAHCRGENRDQARFCGHCGRPFTAETPEPPKRKARRHLFLREKVLVSFGLGLLVGILFCVPWLVQRPATSETLSVRRPKLSKVQPEEKATTAHVREERHVSSPRDVFVERARIEDRIFQAVNRVRYEHGIPPLLENPRLRRVARRHSEDMVARNFFSHFNPDGEAVWDRVRVEGIEGYSLAGENIYACRGCGDLAREVVQGWLSSPGHRRTMLEPSCSESGLGIAWDTEGKVYITQVYLARGQYNTSLP